MNVLLIYPEFPKTHWNFKYVLKLISKRATEPPLGLLTVSSFLPGIWNKKLVDMNVSRLRDRDIKWADLIFISGMDVQKPSFKYVLKRCGSFEAKIIAGGPMVTQNQEDFPEINHFILGEAENILQAFLDDLAKGEAARLYKSPGFPDITNTPVPDWSLINMRYYATMDIQYSRGCPYDCEFCSIKTLFGNLLRLKSTRQFIAELESLYKAGWTGNVFIVDDNFIGNKTKLKSSLLPELINWQRKNNYPFKFNTEVSINAADDEELIDMMIDSGFTSCFVGIETPEETSLAECGKKQNISIDMIESVKKLQRKGLDVSGGFIIGFDNDKEDIFSKQYDFIQKSGIVNAMVGLLNAPPGTKLYKRLKAENRLINTATGNNTDGSLNFITKIDSESLIENYKMLVQKLYSPKIYLERIITFLSEYKMPEQKFTIRGNRKLITAVKVILKLGFLQISGKYYFWKMIFHTIRNYPSKLVPAITLAVYGLHFRNIYKSL